MDRSLDEIVAENQRKRGRGRGPRRGGGGRDGGGGGGRPRERESFPRDGVRKSTREDLRGMDSEWVHDRFEDNSGHGRSRQPRRRSPPASYETRGTKVKVDNLHYELTQEDLEGLFSKIGPVVKLELVYDRAGRSDGTAFVTYDRYEDAKEAVREFDGANAKGQPIRLALMPSAPRRNAFDTAHMPGRPLADRITVPSGRSRSLSPNRYADNDRNIDRYVPGGGRRSRSPLPRRRGGGRRPGARREGGAHSGQNEERKGREGRPKKTQEELDAEMADYFAPGG
ncbi:uncharacterized protein BCR38DRAFT_366782, partial [Pseudomassariella vexata]